MLPQSMVSLISLHVAIQINLRCRDFIYPLFIHDADYKEEISSMPDCFRLSLSAMVEEVAEAIRYSPLFAFSSNIPWKHLNN